MVIGLAFLLLAALLMLAIGYYTMLGASRDMAVLDQRIARLSVPPELVRMRLPMRVPDMIAPLLARAQIEPTPRMIGILVGTLALIFLAALALSGPGAALIAVVAPAAFVVFYVSHRAQSRVDTFIDGLPFYLDGVRQFLSVGNSLPQALVRALPNASPVIQSYVGPAARRIELGAPLVESLSSLAEQLRVPEMSMLVAAVRVNMRFGGPMSTVLGNLAQIVRERLRIKRELKSATAEIKVSTRLLMGLPLAMVAFLFVTNRAYILFFVEDPRGHSMAMYAIGLQLAGMLVMNRMMRLAF